MFMQPINKSHPEIFFRLQLHSFPRVCREHNSHVENNSCGRTPSTDTIPFNVGKKHPSDIYYSHNLKGCSQIICSLRIQPLCSQRPSVAQRYSTRWWTAPVIFVSKPRRLIVNQSSQFWIVKVSCVDILMWRVSESKSLNEVRRRA